MGYYYTIENKVTGERLGDSDSDGYAPETYGDFESAAKRAKALVKETGQPHSVFKSEINPVIEPW